MKRYKVEYGMLVDTKENEILEHPYHSEYVDAEIARDLYETVAEIASLYKSDVVPSDDFCWDEVVEMCRKAKKKADED